MQRDGAETDVQPVVRQETPSCGTSLRGRLGFVVTELASLRGELREHRDRHGRQQRTTGRS